MPVDDFIPTVAVSPPEALLQWFQGEGSGQRVRVPMVVTPSPLGVSTGYIAASAKVPEAEGLSLHLDDSALGIALADRIRTDCPADVPCAVWVEGHFGPTVVSLEPPGSSTGDPRPTFSVRAYVGLVEGPAPTVLQQAK